MRMMILAQYAGAWTGTNGFRLMPADPLETYPATATVNSAAGGHLTTVAYGWTHPDDGPQDGLVVVGAGEREDSLVAMWGDSWHQKPALMSLTGGPGQDSTVALEAEYAAGWLWRIVFDVADPERLQMRMDNVIPAEHGTAEAPAGPYPAMVFDVRRG